MPTEKINDNLFDLLGLDPEEPWDQEKFERILGQKQLEWSHKSSGVGRKALDAKRNLEALSHIHSTMSNMERRNAHKAAIEQERLTEREARQQKFMQQLRLMEAKGYLEEDEVASLCKDFIDILSAEQVAEQIHVERRPSTAEQTDNLPIDTSTKTTIEELLSYLQIPSLYELLNKPHDASNEDLYQAAEQLNTKMVQRRDNSGEALAKLKLAGFAQTIFSSDAKRRFYDSIVREGSLDSLFENLDKSIIHSNIHERQAELFIEEAQALGWKLEEAYDKLAQHARQKKWYLPPESLKKRIRKQQNNKELEQMIAQKLFYTAQEFLKGLRSDEIDNKQTRQREIQANIAIAENFVKRAHAILTIAHEQKLSNCREALRACADCKAAQVFLSDLLPPPRNLQAHIETMKVQLTWEPLPLADITYKIIGKVNTQPTSDTDGIYLGITTAPIFQDTGLTSGVSAYYAVFASCDGIVSRKGAFLQYPVFLTAHEDALKPAVDKSVQATLEDHPDAIENVTMLTFQQIGTVLRLKWKWPEKCQEVTIFYGNEDYPQPRSREAIMNSHRVTREAYDAFGYYDLRGKTNQTLYLIVAAIVEQRGGKMMASGMRLLAHIASRIVIDYEIKIPNSRRKEHILHLRTQAAVPVQLPAFYIRSKQNGLPLKNDDGQPFFKWSEDIRITKEYSIPLPDTSALPSNTFGRIFLEEGIHSIVEFRLPALDKLRLNP